MGRAGTTTTITAGWREEGLCDRIDLMDQVREYREHAPQAYWDTVAR